MSEKRSVFSMPLLYGIARGDCLYLFCFCASLPHMSITRQLVAAGVDPQTAEREACRMEHTISQKSFELLKGAVEPE